jgi:hypothetical protein
MLSAPFFYLVNMITRLNDIVKRENVFLRYFFVWLALVPGGTLAAAPPAGEIDPRRAEPGEGQKYRKNKKVIDLTVLLRYNVNTIRRIAMKANDIVKNLMKERNLTQGELTKIMGKTSQSAISGALNRDMKISTLVSFLDALNCTLVIKDKNGNEWTVENE